MFINREIAIEDLVKIPGATTLLVRHGLPCLICGEPAWGSFDDLVRQQGVEPERVEELLRLLNDLAEAQQ